MLNVLIKKVVFDKCGLFDRQFEKQRMGDGEFGTRIYLSGFKNISNPKVKLFYSDISDFQTKNNYDVIMIDYEEEDTNCELIHDYSFYQAEQDKVVKSFLSLKNVNKLKSPFVG